MKLVALFASLAGALILTVITQPVWPETQPVTFQVKGMPKPSQELVEKCHEVIHVWAPEGTDMWVEQMEVCVYYDPDYLTPLDVSKNDESFDYLTEVAPQLEGEDNVKRN